MAAVAAVVWVPMLPLVWVVVPMLPLVHVPLAEALALLAVLSVMVGPTLVGMACRLVEVAGNNAIELYHYCSSTHPHHLHTLVRASCCGMGRVAGVFRRNRGLTPEMRQVWLALHRC